jgi:hypothetical protein
MRVIMFQDRFVDKVRSGAKTTTIRTSDWHIKPGTVLSLRRWTGKPYRSKQEILREAVCVSVEGIHISKIGCAVETIPGYSGGFTERGHENDIAKQDGFASFPDMVDWFEKNHGLPFDGYLIRWEDK